ncbi:hypothetical protein [Tenacibaculum maritimum]|uniref:hypothetical protein n=1 Tax=Tenacibaculum maritimum TaxID=107401 RepID=UPI001E47A587|nr:hypothetical protein [Tenacibaculum maritimum]MCD9611283.1 hypothetical protein [Tenacibaculum maritimum]
MKNTVKSITYIGGKSFLKWITLITIGFVITALFFIVALYMNIGRSGGGHGSIYGLFIGLLIGNIPGLVIIFGAPIFFGIYIAFANKITIQNAIHLFWENNAGEVLLKKVRTLTSKIVDTKDWKTFVKDKKLFQKTLLQENNNTDTPKLQKKIINYILKKVRLEDVDFKDPKLKISEVIADKFGNLITENIKPSLKSFWIVMLVQFLLFVLSLKYA